MADAETLINAFVSSTLDYCNVLLSGLLCASTQSLQMIPNAAAWILTQTNKFHGITPIWAPLHWLSTHVRSEFKVFLVPSKIVNGHAPSYLSDLLKPYKYAIPCSPLSELKWSQWAAGPFPIMQPSSGITLLQISDSLTLLRPLKKNLKLIFST